MVSDNSFILEAGGAPPLTGGKGRVYHRYIWNREEKTHEEDRSLAAGAGAVREFVRLRGGPKRPNRLSPVPGGRHDRPDLRRRGSGLRPLLHGVSGGGSAGGLRVQPEQRGLPFQRAPGAKELGQQAVLCGGLHPRGHRPQGHPAHGFVRRRLRADQGFRHRRQRRSGDVQLPLGLPAGDPGDQDQHHLLPDHPGWGL